MEAGTTVMQQVQISEAVLEKHVYSVWALPREDMRVRVKKLMEGLRSEFGGPQFEPHVTVIGAIRLTEAEARDRFKKACETVKAYSATVEKIDTGTFYYQCVYLLLHPTTEVVEASALCCSHFGYNRSEYKPPIEDLQYFLDFQIARVWAPEQNNLQRKEPVCLSLQFSLMGPKLYISPDQVTVGRKPVTGLRLSLEGDKQNRLSVNLQHLVSLPKILQPHWDSHMAIGAPKWKGPEEQDSRWFEPIKWKNFSHVSTAPIEHTETSIGDLSGVHIVTGAQLGVWNFGAKSVLHLKLLFSKVPGCTIRRSVWDHSPSNLSAVQRIDGSSTSLQNENKKGDTSSQTGKLAKIVDMTEMSKGPQDAPGHWLVTGAKLGVDKGKIVLRVKYSLLNY